MSHHNHYHWHRIASRLPRDCLETGRETRRRAERDGVEITHSLFLWYDTSGDTAVRVPTGDSDTRIAGLASPPGASRRSSAPRVPPTLGAEADRPVSWGDAFFRVHRSVYDCCDSLCSGAAHHTVRLNDYYMTYV
jgi:hypothetical protein